MARRSRHSKQKYLLLQSLVLLLAASGGLILSERLQKSQPAASVSRTPTSQQAVAGASIALSESYAHYRQSAARILAAFNVLFNQLKKGEAIDKDKIAQVIADLLAQTVPGPYQKLHFQLLTLFTHLRDQAAPDLDYLREQRRRLAEEFTWLPRTAE